MDKRIKITIGIIIAVVAIIIVAKGIIGIRENYITVVPNPD